MNISRLSARRTSRLTDGRRIAVISLLICGFALGAFAVTGGPASISLSSSDLDLTRISAPRWTLSKTGAIDTVNSNIVWTISAGKGCMAEQLIVTGFMAVKNSGSGDASIGNIVVNLQTKANNVWKTRSSDVADATSGDAATAAQIDRHGSSEGKSTFMQNSASQTLEFMDATFNSVFSLVPEKTIAPNQTVHLLFAASFDNRVLKLGTGQAIRAEVIVSFGNSTPRSPSAPNVDINGNGVVDPDEAWVRSVANRRVPKTLTRAVDTGPLTISDAASDIATTGTVSFSNPIFNLGATSGTVTAHYGGGTSGGNITNCAHGNSPGAVVRVEGFQFNIAGATNLEACNTQTIGASSCTPGSPGCGWEANDLVTYDQISWGDTSSTAAANLSNNFETVFPSGQLEIGIPGNAGYSMRFTAATSILDYLPASGANDVLTADLVDSTSSSSGAFGGDLTALELNIAFSDSHLLGGSASTPLGDLYICNFAPVPSVNGQTVREFAATANSIIGGAAGPFGPDEADAISTQINAAFVGGSPSTFAQEHLFVGPCPCTHGTPGCSWTNNDLKTFTESSWTGTGTTTLVNDNAFATSFGVLTIGTSSGHSASFTTVNDVEAFLPQAGTPDMLDSNLTNPTSTSAGAFAGEVVALTLNVAFWDAGATPKVGTTAFGDVHVCGTGTSLDGSTVRQVLTTNTLLSVGPVSTITEVDPVLSEINVSFENGLVFSPWAQVRLINGTCP